MMQMRKDSRKVNRDVQKKWTEDKKQRYINPYNFIPFKSKCEYSELEIDYKNSYTGVLKCSLELLTPLFIPNTTCDLKTCSDEQSTDEIESIHSCEFFSYHDLSGKGEEIRKIFAPIVPASSIRGMVRSVFEIAFAGCMSVVGLEEKIGKKNQSTTVGKCLEADKVQPCENIEKLCTACKIFGMVGKNSNAVASRVRFTDAVLKKEEEIAECYEDPIVIPQLMGPRVKTLEFYTKISKERAEKLKLRGRKYYWHHAKIKKWCQKDNKGSNKVQKIRPLKPTNGNKNLFVFKIYFENLTKEELKKLQWAIDFDSEQYAHKLGEAKPLGFGSVRIHIDEMKLRSLDLEIGNWKSESVGLSEFLTGIEIAESEEIKHLKYMTDWENKPVEREKENEEKRCTIAYPKGWEKEKTGDTIYLWFKGNREIEKGKSFSKELPMIEEELQEEAKEKWLYRLKKTNKKNE